MSKKSLSHAEIVVIVLIVGVLAAVLLPALTKHRETRHRRACVNNLKQLGLALHLYAEENNRRYAPVDDWGHKSPFANYPPVDDIKNNFMFDADPLYPEYLTDAMLAMCPGDPRRDPETNFRLKSDHPADGAPEGQTHPDCFTGDSYIYVGWMVMIFCRMTAIQI